METGRPNVVAGARSDRTGAPALVMPGPRGGHKLTEEVLAWAEEQLAARPGLRPAQLPGLIEDAFGVRVHPRSVERALARRRERHSKSRGTDRPRDTGSAVCNPRFRLRAARRVFTTSIPAPTR